MIAALRAVITGCAGQTILLLGSNYDSITSPSGAVFVTYHAGAASSQPWARRRTAPTPRLDLAGLALPSSPRGRSPVGGPGRLAGAGPPAAGARRRRAPGSLAFQATDPGPATPQSAGSPG